MESRWLWGEDGEVEYGGLSTSKLSGEHSLGMKKIVWQQ